MKNFTLSILFCTGMYCTHAQPYQPMLDSVSNVWYYTGNIMPVMTIEMPPNCNYQNWGMMQAGKMLTSGDTLIGTETWLKLEEVFPPFTYPDCLFGYLREDTAARKVYFMDNQLSPEILLYDFSMQPGDSIYYDFYNLSGYYDSAYYTLDSIVTINQAAGPRRVFFLSNHSLTWPMQYPMEWIESVGHPGHPVFTHSANMGWGGLFMGACWPDYLIRDYYQIITCFEHDSQKVFFDSCAHSMAINNMCFAYDDSCTYYIICGSLEEINPLYYWSLSPNPSNGMVGINMESSQQAKVHLNLYDLRGVRIREYDLEVKEGDNRTSLDLSFLSPGIYLMGVQGSYRKLVMME